MNISLRFLVALVATTFLLKHSLVMAAQKAELKQGRYTGYISFPQAKLAVVTDIFLESPEDLTKFPSLNAIFKLNLGGNGSNEYRTEIFKDLKYDFDQGALTFDEMNNDLVVITIVQSNNGRLQIKGKAFIRSTATWGTLDLTLDSDEPQDFSEFLTNTSLEPLQIPQLAGQYQGLCNGQQTALQIQTARGLGDRKIDAKNSSGLEKDYGITGRFGFKNDSLCSGTDASKWCIRDHYSDGSYNFVLGHLALRGERSSIRCIRTNPSTFSCDYQAFSKFVKCDLSKQVEKFEIAKFYPRQFNLRPTPEQAKPLPEPSPPANTQLAQDLAGDFHGFIHNESNNTYLPLKLEVIAFSSTENPHNPNQMMFSSTASIFLKSFDSRQFYTQRFDPRSFYLRPGLTISGHGTDSFLSIIEWKKGFIRGDFYSHAFGKVGSFQLLKGPTITPPPAVDVVDSFQGEFERLLSRGNLTQWLKFEFPAQPNDIKDNLIRFTGAYQSIKDVTPIRDIEVGYFDPLTGQFGWQITAGDGLTFGDGRIRQDSSLDIFWPPQPVVGVTSDDYKPSVFLRKR